MLESDLWLVALAVAAVANVVMAWRYEKSILDMRDKTARVLEHTSSVLEVLEVWADTWGEPPEIVRPRLQSILKKKEKRP